MKYLLPLALWLSGTTTPPLAFPRPALHALCCRCSGNNHLGGQDFNERLQANVSAEIERRFARPLENIEDIQSLRTAVEKAKLALTYSNSTVIELELHFDDELQKFRHVVSRMSFESLNCDLFDRILEPIDRVLDEAQLTSDEIEEVVLVGGSTRIPRVRELVREYFGGRDPNVAIDPELAVATGVSVQAGILGGMWPLTVSAIEVPTAARKIFIH